MAVPARRTSKTKKRLRRKSHHVSLKGYYGGKKVMDKK